MGTLSVVQDWMLRIGPLLDLERVTAFAEEQSWSLVADDGLEVVCTLDDTLGRLVLEAEVDLPAASRRVALMEALLRWNAAWRDHGGARAALASAQGPVVLLLDAPTQGLDLPSLQALVSRFADLVRGWGEAMNEAEASGGPLGGLDVHLTHSRA